ncbi:AMP-binding protein (plasmid) [Polaromonas sp. P1-6]|nr:AMP-binding protein [Polaromonas sp. P1-6]
MLAGAHRTAAALHVAGVRKGDHVGILLGNNGSWIQTFLGIASIGAVTVPVNTRFKVDELRFCLKQADVRLLVFSDEFLGIDFRELLRGAEPALDSALPGNELPKLFKAVMLGQGALPAGAISHADFLAAGRAVDTAELDAFAETVRQDDVLLIQYTSGTTSFPKGVMLTHANMLLDAQAAAKRMGVRHDDRYFSIRPFFHVAGSTLSVLVSVSTGCCLLSLPKFDVAENLAILDRERCSLISGNDTIFLMLMGHPGFDADKLHLRGGWAAAGPEVMEQIHSRMRVPGLCNAYGQSEAAPNVLLSSFDDPLPLRINGFRFSAPRHRGAPSRSRDRPAQGGRGVRRDPGARLERHARLLQDARTDGQGLQRRWLAQDRRSRRDERRRPDPHGQQAQGYVPRRRRERRALRGRGSAARAPGRGPGPGHRRARCPPWRGHWRICAT